jgi:prophage maintenance system killer protein
MNALIDENSVNVKLNELLQLIEEFNFKMLRLSQNDLIIGSKRISEFRTTSSSTIKKEGNDLWLKANLYITKKVELDIAPTWNDIVEINKILDQKNQGKLRTCEIYIGNHQACTASDLNDLLSTFTQEILSNNKKLHPLMWANEVRYWLVTLHPFIDGNGRTSNLLCDWILALNGYLPISHSTKLESFIGGWKGRSHFSDLNFAAVKTLSAIEHSYRIFFQN